jgi:hypothetical protein
MRRVSAGLLRWSAGRLTLPCGFVSAKRNVGSKPTAADYRGEWRSITQLLPSTVRFRDRSHIALKTSSFHLKHPRNGYAAALTRWRTLFEELEALRRADDDALRRMYLECLAEVNPTGTASYDRPAEVTHRFSAVAIDALVSKRTRLVFSRPQRVVLRDRVVVLCRSPEFPNYLSTILTGPGRLPMFLHALNDLAYFESIRMRFKSATQQRARTSGPRTKPSLRDKLATPLMPEVTRNVVASAVTAFLASGETILPHDAVALLLLCHKLQIKLNSSRTVLKDIICPSLGTLEGRALVSLTILLSQLVDSTTDFALTASAVSAVAERFVTETSVSRLTEGDAVHALLALMKLDNCVTKLLPGGYSRVLVKPRVITALLARMFPTIPRPNQDERRSIQARHESRLKRRVERLQQLRAEAQTLRARSTTRRRLNEERKLCGEIVERKMLGYELRYSEQLQLAQSRAVGNVSAEALIEVAAFLAMWTLPLVKCMASGTDKRQLDFLSHTSMALCLRELSTRLAGADLPFTINALSVAVEVHEAQQGRVGEGYDTSLFRRSCTALIDASLLAAQSLISQVGKTDNSQYDTCDVSQMYRLLTLVGRLVSAHYFEPNSGMRSEVFNRTTIYSVRHLVETVTQAVAAKRNFRTPELTPAQRGLVVEACVAAEMNAHASGLVVGPIRGGTMSSSLRRFAGCL